MKCPKCQFDNREGAKFCNECGHKFKQVCPECGVTDRVGSKFCDECGYDLGTSKKASSIDYSRPQSYTPNFKDAEIELTRALTQAKQLGNPTLLWKTHQAAGNLLLKRSKSKDAKAQFQTALKVVQDIAEGLTDVALEEGDLQSDPIQELFLQAQGGPNQVKGGIHG